MKEKRVPLTSRISAPLKKALIDYCDREGLIIERFVEEAIIRELEVRRTHKK